MWKAAEAFGLATCARRGLSVPQGQDVRRACTSPSVIGAPDSELPQYNLLFSDESALCEALLATTGHVTLIAPSGELTVTTYPSGIVDELPQQAPAHREYCQFTTTALTT